MTLSTSTNKITYTCNGTTNEFAVPFLFFADSHISVRIKTNNEQAQTLKQDDDYTLSGAGNAAGGTCVLTTAPENGAELLILRDVPYKQETRYIDGDPMPAPLLERNLDALTMMCQQLEEQCARAVAVDMFSASNPSEIIGKVEDLYADKDNLDIVAKNIASVKTDAENMDFIKAVMNNIGAVQTVGGNIAAVNGVSAKETELTALYGKLAELLTVYGKLAQVQTVSDAVNDIVLCAAEMAAIKDAPNQASAAANSATEAANQAQASAASASAAAASDTSASASASAALASQQQSAASATAAANSAAEAANQAQASAASASAAAASAAAAQVGLATDAEFSAGTATNKAPTVKQAATLAPKAMFQVVSALPASPNANTFYFIPG